MLKRIRRAVQISVALAFVAIPWLNALDVHWLSGNFLSFDLLGLPLADPLAALQVSLSAGALPWRLVLGGVIALGIAAALGAVFCSWLCPYGLVSELIRQIRHSGEKPGYHRSGFLPKLAVYGLAVALVGLLGAPPVLNQLSLPGVYSRTFQALALEYAVPAGLALLAGAVVLDLVAGRRLWCRYVCPQSLLLMAVGSISPKRLRVTFSPRHCTCAPGTSPCAAACPLDLNPRGRPAKLERECNNCGDCTVACASRGGALQLRFASRPGRKDAGRQESHT